MQVQRLITETNYQSTTTLLPLSSFFQRVEEMSSVDNNNSIAASINKLSLTSDVSTCANCSKEISNPNECNKCKAATYCNAACKKRHRSKHKEACERRVAEMHEEQLEREKRAAELNDEQLFKQPPPFEDCLVCMLPLPPLVFTGSKYRVCCGKTICSGCIHAVSIRDGGVSRCPFCRTPAPTTNKEVVKMVKKRIEVNDVEAIRNLACFYNNGLRGLPQNHAKALELWHRAAELGHAISYYNIGVAYYHGIGVERDEKKANHYYELAAMGGHVNARRYLGLSEVQAGNMERALRHYMIATGAGYTRSLNDIKLMFMHGDATKEVYTNALRVYQASLNEIKSPQRDEAAAVRDNYKYY